MEEVEYVKVEVDNAHPVQIVASGSATEENAFILQNENIDKILQKIPKNTKVAVLSVVGAFRSGKSFLLTFFLRYLRHGSADDLTLNWMTADGSKLKEGNRNDQLTPDDKSTPEGVHRDGFAWSGGHNRQTTGIWMWSEPFIRKVASYPEPIAILLMDTQGMFDNETTMALTAKIFGLSTLISSYQIYNVDKRIQEDNLQHLALFSEYGRMALGENTPDDSTQDANKKDVPSSETKESHLETLSETKESRPETRSEEHKVEARPLTTPFSMSRQRSSKLRLNTHKPFQRIEFLVRDWQNFEMDWEELVTKHGNEDVAFKILHTEMIEYLNQVIKTRTASDLQSTRDQISKCFEKVTCYLLPHPGPVVTKKTYNGDIEKIDDCFRSLLNRYVRNIFDTIIEPKMINNRYLSATELLTFIHAYAAIFQDEDTRFPKAMTMLEATADANNRNAYDLAIADYRTKMDRAAGPEASFIKESQLNAIHEDALDKSLTLFDNMAEMGAESAIEKVRDQLLSDIEKDRVRYFDSNSNRNPFKNVEFYAIPFIIAATSWILAVVVDKTCSTDLCEQAEDGFQNIYLFIFFGFIILTWRRIAGSWEYLKEVVPLLLQARIGNIAQLSKKTT